MNNSVGKNNRHVRNLNRIGIIALLRDYGSLTKAEIAAKMNLTFTAVNNLVEELMRDRLIAEAGFYDESSRGRKPKLLSLNSGDIYAVGVHISASSVRAAVINLQGKAMMEKRSIFEDNANRGSVVNVIISTIQAVLDESGLKSQIIGIGVGAPGPLDPVQGKILSPPNLPGLHQVRLKGLIEENTELPTQIEKDANVMALGELWYGNGRHFSNLVYVDADIGIGSGLIFNQKIYQGTLLEPVRSGTARSILTVRAAIAAIMAAWKRSPPASPSSAGSEKSCGAELRVLLNPRLMAMITDWTSPM